MMQQRQPHCPRCGSQLQQDSEVLSCIVCCYEFAPSATDLEWRWLTVRRVTTALPLLLLRGVSPWLTIAGVAVVVLAPLVALSVAAQEVGGATQARRH